MTSSSVRWCGLVIVVAGACGGDSVHKLPDGPGGGDGGGGTPLTGVTAISAGHGFACALLTGGAMRCWGTNDNGELGSTVNDPTLHCASVRCNGPIIVPNVTATAIAAGLGYVCVLHADGTVACWGDNTNGVLGDGTTTASGPPVAVTGLTHVQAISAGAQTMCALQSTPAGAVQCWGGNVFGQLGNGSIANSLTPTAPTGLSTATAVASGNGRTCALTTDGLECWGDNNLGELGDGTTGNYAWHPETVNGLAGTTAVSTGGFITCALLTDKTVTCWGNDSNGELGIGSISSTPIAMPGMAVSGLSNVSVISAGREGANYACALTGGTVQCWGLNDFGQLGNGTTTDSSTPVAVTGLSGVTAIATGDAYACALLGDGTVKCWGSNNESQLGNGSTTDSSTPVVVTEPN